MNFDKFQDTKKTSVRTNAPPGGKSNFSLAWDNTPSTTTTNSTTSNKKVILVILECGLKRLLWAKR